jgi:phosphatidylserine/phosphatidylglycerophosphate/cardiolipin synthase-like enzyme
MADTRGQVVFNDLFHTRDFRRQFISSFSEPIESIIICSPFFDGLPPPFKDVIEFCAFMQRRGTEDIQIVTRPPGAHQAMSLTTAKQLSGMGVKLFIRSTPFYHVKMYHIEYTRGYFKTFVGSANFTMGGFDRNSELVAELQGSGNATACHREIARMRDSGGALSYGAWAGKGQPQGDKETV